MTFPMPRQTLDQALTLTPGDGPDRTADLTADFSNAPLAWPADKGAPFGGLMAALAVRAMREGLDIQPPLMTLTVQYLAAARFAPVTFSPTLERGGRSVAYASVRAGR
ncbi:MAG TPA: thioesterase family protein, partial [Brevundimonas sp.]|nr:thioesterase family protein [Brevundimonas sp.]